MFADMRRRLVLLVFALTAVVGLGVGSASPAGAAPAIVRVGKTGCGQTQVWVDGRPVFQDVDCQPPVAPA